MPIVIGLGDTAWNDPLNIFGGKPPAPEPPKPVAETKKPRFTLTEQDRQDLRKTIAAEAAGEGETGMIAVGNVIRNRAERRGKSLADVVREPNQFTGYEVPGPDALQILQDPDQVAKIDSIIDRMAAGELPDITGGADHYHANYVSPDWAGKMPKTAEVGQHLFYRAENGPDTKRKPMPTYDELAGQIGLDGDPFEAVLKGETAPASDRKPKGRGMADLLPDEPEPMKGNGGPLAFVNPGQEKIAPEFRSVLEGASQDLGRGLTVLSGFRAPTHAVEAAKNKPGEHSHGTASDISMKGMNEQERATLVQSLLARGAKRFITYSNSPDMLHVDMKDQLGDGTPWFMHDKSNRNLSRAPGWFQEIAKNPTPAQKAIEAQAPAAAGATAAPAATGNTIVIDEGFAASDPMGLLAGENPFAGIVDQAKAAKAAEQEQVANQFEQNRITGLNQIANRETGARRAELEAQSPGRYVEIDAAELPEFQKKWEEENRSEGVLGDTGRILKSGVIGVGQSLTSLADTIFSNVPGGKEFLKASDDIDRWLLGETLDQRMDTAKARTNASVTPEQAEADVKNWWDSDRGTFGPAWRDPRSYLRTVGESVPATVVTMAPGGMLARGAYLRTLAATGSERAAAAAAARTATVAGALLEGTMGGADTARVVRDRIAAIPRDQLLETDTVKALIEGGMSEDQAIAALTDDASTKAFAIAGVATGMFGGMGDRALAKILAEGVGGGIAQRMLTGAARGMVAEGLLEEAPQGAAQTIAGNIGVRDAKPEQDLTEGMGEAVASGIAAGGVMGGGMGAAGGAASPPSSGAASVDENAAATPAAAAPTPTAAPAPRGPIGRSVKHAEDQIAQRQAANPAPSPVTSPQPSADGRPAPGATVTVSADGIEPFMGTVQSYEGDEAVVSTADGELFQVPLGTLSVNAPPVQTIPDRGPQPINDTIPEFSTDPALEPLPPAAAEVTSEGLPPRSEQKDATERFPSAPTPGQRVIVDDENGGRFAATVQSYESNSTEALVRTDDGKDLQVPVSSLKVSKLTPKQIEAQELERNPPVEREVGDAGPTSRTVLGKTIVLPDDKHARLFDLGKERQAQKRVMGTSALDLDRVDPRELKALAQEFGISEQGVGQLADDYATRMVRNVRSANSKLPQRMPPVMDNILARWRRDAVDAEAATAPAADETQSWWDRDLDDEGRRLAMISANIKRPPKTPWADLSPAMQRKLAVVRSEQQAAAAAQADVDSTEANSVESEARINGEINRYFNAEDDSVPIESLSQEAQDRINSMSKAERLKALETIAFEKGKYESAELLDEETFRQIYGEAKPNKNAREAYSQIEEESGQGTAGEEGPFGPILRGYKGRWREAALELERRQSGDAIGALSHPEVGPIDLVWGEAGSNQSNGSGLAKLIAWHPEVLVDLQGFINRLKVDSERSTKRRIQLVDATGNAGIRLDYDGSEKTWLLTAYETGQRRSERSSRRLTDLWADRTAPASPPLNNVSDTPENVQPSIDDAANEAATSPQNNLPEPTPAQKEAGNYKVGRISLGGLDISIENPAGSERKGTDKDGKAWSIKMKSHYGYIRGTVGRDKDHIDVFVKPGTETIDAASPVFIVDQENADGSFDEHKVMLGYGSQDEAEKAYLENYTKGWKIGPVTATPLSGFKDWLKRGYTDEPASIEINEVFWNPPSADNDFLDEFGEGRRPPETKEQIYDDLATRISVPKFVERVATNKEGMGAAFIEPSGKLYLIRGTDNQNGDHAEFFGRMFANNHITERDDGYVRISSYSDYFGYSTGGDISQAAAATIKALETAAARAGINVIKPASDFKVVGETPADEKAQAEGAAPTAPAAAAQKPAGKIDDFGEKIAGARKDMVRDFQNALSADVDFQNEPLSKIFPQPDYEKLAESGVERRVLAVTALIRDEIPAKPRKGYKVDRWAKQVKTLRDFAAGLMSGRLSEEEFRKRLLDAPTLSNLANTADLIADLPLSKLSEAAKWRVRSGNYTIFEGVKLEGSTRLLTLSDADGRMVRDKDGRVISAKTFEELKAAALPIMRAALSDDTPAPKKRTPVAVYSDRTTKAIFIGFKGQSGVIRLKSGFASVKDARAYISENADDIQAMIDEMRAGFNMRREINRPREGEARRDGDVTPEQFQEAFGFRGVQFGNYVEDARRQFELNEAFDGLMDLAEVLGLPPRALSLNGTLGLAFGARGRGGANAAKAHFEADQIAINLTKAKGAGSLAHEWFHGLDNYFGRMDTSGNMAAMISKDKARGGGTRDEIWRAWKAVADSLDQGSYAKRMRKADEARSTPYWNTTVEKVARGFEKYVVDRLADKRASNDYLANIDENAGAYPTDQEMAEQGVTAAFDKLFSTIETKVEESGNVKMFEGRSDGEPLALQPRMDKLADPEAIIPSDPAFRRIPVPSRPADAAPFTWARDLVLDRGRKNGNEFLIAIDDDGTVVDFGTSDHAKFVGLNARLSKAVANPDRRLVLMHNHPSNWPLSLADLSMLLHPGVFSVWAFGHGGIETRAALTGRGKAALALGTTATDIAASIDRFEKAMRDVERSIETVLISNLDKREIDVSQAEIAHFMAIPEIARRAGVIEFTVNQPYDHAKIPMLDRAIDNAALKLARTLLDERATPQTSDARVLRQAVSVQHIAELGGLAENRSDVEGRNEGQSGLREGSARDYQAEAQGRNARRLTGSRRISENSIVEAISGKWTDLNPSLLATVPLNYFVELARPNMTAVKEYMSVKRLMDAYRGDKHAKADAIAGEWLKYMRLGFGQSNKAKAQELADLMHESTLAGIDPSQTDEETRAKAGYDILRKRYQALPAKGKELFAKVRDAYRAQADELDQILLDNVRKSQQIAKDQAEARYRKKLEEIRADRSMNPLDRRKAEEDAASRYKAESTKMDWSAKARLTKLRIQFESNRVPAPYFPLGRFGQYFVTAKDVDGSVISFSKFERAADRDRFAREIQRDYPGATVTKGVMKDMTDPRAAMDPRMVAEIEQLLGNAGVDQDLMDMVYQRYLETLPELSMRKRYMHRKGTAGYDTDALRVFSSHMFHAAHQMAKLKYGLELQELVNTTFDQAEAADDQTRAMRLANEMASRHKWVMNPTGGSLAQTMTSTAFVWFLAASPAAAVLNLTQTFMMGLPILGARFGGITRAGVEVAKASADLISGKGSVRNANLSREEMAAVDAFYRSGMIDRTQSHDLAGVGDTGVRYSPLRARVMGVMSWAFHNTEVWNREATALAAYRLARKAGQSHLAAIDSAHDLTWKTHFDYANSSRPRIMQNDFAKVALVFRSYSINMLYRLFRDIHQSVKGESAQARREARYQLAGVTGMMALMSGVTGVFGFNMIMAIAGMVFGDDDDPMDFDERFKADVLDILGPELGGVVLKGVPGHYLGIDLTSRIGMPDLWFRSPGQDLQGKEEWNYWLSQTLGATAGIGEQWFRGASLIMEGDVARGVEVMAPKFIRDPMKAFRYANEGLQSIKGDELLSADQIGIHGAVAQAMGVSPAIVSETWDRSGALKNAERRVMDERQRVVNAWAMAALAGDKEGVAEAIERVKVFNKKPIHSAIPITQDTLKRSIKTRVRNAAKREDGVLIQNEILSQRLRAAMPERLY